MPATRTTTSAEHPKKRRSFFASSLAFLPNIGAPAKPAIIASEKVLAALGPPSAVIEPAERAARALKKKAVDGVLASVELDDGTGDDSASSSKRASNEPFASSSLLPRRSRSLRDPIARPGPSRGRSRSPSPNIDSISPSLKSRTFPRRAASTKTSNRKQQSLSLSPEPIPKRPRRSSSSKSLAVANALSTSIPTTSRIKLRVGTNGAPSRRIPAIESAHISTEQETGVPGNKASRATSNNEKLGLAMQMAMRATIGGRTTPYTRDTSWLGALKSHKGYQARTSEAKAGKARVRVKYVPEGIRKSSRANKGKGRVVQEYQTDDEDDYEDEEVELETEEEVEVEIKVTPPPPPGKGKEKAIAQAIKETPERKTAPGNKKDYMNAGFYCQDANASSPNKLVNKVLNGGSDSGSGSVSGKGKGKEKAPTSSTSRSEDFTDRPTFPPLPYDHGYDHFFGQEHEFVLPYNIRWDMENGGLEGKKRPPPYTKLRANMFVERNRILSAEGPAICHCEPESRCGDNCINRVMNYLCGKDCPAGDICENKNLTKRKMAATKVVYTGPRGFGLVAMEDIGEGDFVTDYRGEIISLDLFVERIQSDYRGQRNFYALAYDQDEVIDAGMKGNDARFINHSCDPNIEVRKYQQLGDGTEEYEIGMWARRDIPKGQELTYDYNFDSFASAAESELRTKCHCGAINCVGYLGRRAGEKSAKELALELQAKVAADLRNATVKNRSKTVASRGVGKARKRLGGNAVTKARAAIKVAKRIAKVADTNKRVAKKQKAEERKAAKGKGKATASGDASRKIPESGTAGGADGYSEDASMNAGDAAVLFYDPSMDQVEVTVTQVTAPAQDETGPEQLGTAAAPVEIAETPQPSGSMATPNVAPTDLPTRRRTSTTQGPSPASPAQAETPAAGRAVPKSTPLSATRLIHIAESKDFVKPVQKDTNELAPPVAPPPGGQRTVTVAKLIDAAEGIWQDRENKRLDAVAAASTSASATPTQSGAMPPNQSSGLTPKVISSALSHGSYALPSGFGGAIELRGDAGSNRSMETTRPIAPVAVSAPMEDASTNAMPLPYPHQNSPFHPAPAVAETRPKMSFWKIGSKDAGSETAADQSTTPQRRKTGARQSTTSRITATTRSKAAPVGPSRSTLQPSYMAEPGPPAGPVPPIPRRRVSGGNGTLLPRIAAVGTPTSSGGLVVGSRNIAVPSTPANRDVAHHGHQSAPHMGAPHSHQLPTQYVPHLSPQATSQHPRSQQRQPRPPSVPSTPKSSGQTTSLTPGSVEGRPMTAEEEAAAKRKSGWSNWLRREAGEKPRTLQQWHELRMKRRRGVGWMNAMIQEFGIAPSSNAAPEEPTAEAEQPKWLPQSFENTIAAIGQGPDAQPKYRLGGPPLVGNQPKSTMNLNRDPVKRLPNHPLEPGTPNYYPPQALTSTIELDRRVSSGAPSNGSIDAESSAAAIQRSTDSGQDGPAKKRERGRTSTAQEEVFPYYPNNYFPTHAELLRYGAAPSGDKNSPWSVTSTGPFSIGPAPLPKPPPVAGPSTSGDRPGNGSIPRTQHLPSLPKSTSSSQHSYPPAHPSTPGYYQSHATTSPHPIPSIQGGAHNHIAPAGALAHWASNFTNMNPVGNSMENMAGSSARQLQEQEDRRKKRESDKQKAIAKRQGAPMGWVFLQEPVGSKSIATVEEGSDRAVRPGGSGFNVGNENVPGSVGLERAGSSGSGGRGLGDGGISESTGNEPVGLGPTTEAVQPAVNEPVVSEEVNNDNIDEGKGFLDG